MLKVVILPLPVRLLVGVDVRGRRGSGCGGPDLDACALYEVFAVLMLPTSRVISFLSLNGQVDFAENLHVPTSLVSRNIKFPSRPLRNS